MNVFKKKKKKLKIMVIECLKKNKKQKKKPWRINASKFIERTDIYWIKKYEIILLNKYSVLN